jgi:hypothetical protein
MISITLPIVTQIVLVVGAISCIIFWRKIIFKNAMILLAIAGLFPILYAIKTGMPLYNSWRHLLFIYPPLVIVFSIGFIYLSDSLNKTYLQIAIFLGIACGHINPILWCIQNNPYQYTYFNELVGGHQNAYYNYDTDYWQISTKEAIDWLMKNEPISKSQDTQAIGTNAYTFSNYYFKKRYPGVKVKAVALGEKANFGAPGVYTIFNSLFLEPAYLENCYPSPLSIHTIDIDGKAASYIAKDTAKYTYKGYRAFQANNYTLADSFFNLYMKQIKYDGGLKNMTPFFGVIAYTKFATNNFDAALYLGHKCVQSYPSDFMSNLALGTAHLSKKDYVNAKIYLNNALQIKPDEPGVLYYLSLLPKN